MNKLLQREVRVAFHRKSQPVWSRMLKYVLLGLFVYFYWSSPAFWRTFGCFSLAGVGLHIFYRYKTHGWTRSYGRGFLRWDYDRIFGDSPPDKIGPVDRERPVVKRRIRLLVLILISAVWPGGQAFAQQPTTSAYRQVAEYEPTEAVWLLYPQVTHKKELPIEPVIVNLIRAIAPYARVNLIVPNDSLRQRATALLPDSLLTNGRVTLHTFPYQEFWARDMGPRFLQNARGQKAMADFSFNTWGYADTTDATARLDEQLDERIAARLQLPVISSALITEGGDQEINRQGVLLAVRAVEKERNPSHSFGRLEAEFKRVLGATKVIWLTEGLRDDDHTFRGPVDGPQGTKYYTTLTTNGHVDEVARFVNDSTILLAWIDPADQRNPLERETGRRMDENDRILRKATDVRGHPFRILRMRLPNPITTTLQPGDGVYDIICQLTYRDGSVFPVGRPVPVVAAASYLNFLIVNDGVLVPYYWKEGRDPALRKQDEDARRLLKSVFPAKTIIPVDALPVNLGGGGIHCITANEPGRAFR